MKRVALGEPIFPKSNQSRHTCSFAVRGHTEAAARSQGSSSATEPAHYTLRTVGCFCFVLGLWRSNLQKEPEVVYQS